MHIIYDKMLQTPIGICRLIDFPRTITTYLGHDITLVDALDRFEAYAV